MNDQESQWATSLCFSPKLQPVAPTEVMISTCQWLIYIKTPAPGHADVLGFGVLVEVLCILLECSLLEAGKPIYLTCYLLTQGAYLMSTGFRNSWLKGMQLTLETQEGKGREKQRKNSRASRKDLYIPGGLSSWLFRINLYASTQVLNLPVSS